MEENDNTAMGMLGYELGATLLVSTWHYMSFPVEPSGTEIYGRGEKNERSYSTISVDKEIVDF